MRILIATALAAVVLVALGGTYLWLGSVKIETGEEALVLRVGRYHRTMLAGPNVHLPWLETLERERVTNRRLEFGFRTLAPGASPIESAATDGAAPELDERTSEEAQEARMITGDENLVDVQFVLEYNIVDLRTFRLNVADATGVIRDAALSAVRTSVSLRTVDEVLYGGRRAIQEDAQARIEQTLRAYVGADPDDPAGAMGISVVGVLFRDVAAPEEVSAAFRDVASAQQDGDRMGLEASSYAGEVRAQARGEAQAMIADAEGYASAKTLAAEGETARFLALLTEYQKAPRVTRSRLYLETLEAILPKMEKIIMQDPGDRVLPYLPLGRRGEAPR